MANDLEARLAAMNEDQLQEYGAEYDSLTDEAQLLVRTEFSKRSLEPPLINDDSPPEEPQGVRTIRQYRDQAEALLARSVLESAGIPCYLRNENTIRIDWLWSNLMGGMRLQVAEENAEAAEALLSQPIPKSIAVEDEADFDQLHCPNCGSLNISAENLNTKVTAASILLLGFPLPAPKRENWLCNDCGARWVDDSEVVPN